MKRSQPHTERPHTDSPPKAGARSNGKVIAKQRIIPLPYATPAGGSQRDEAAFVDAVRARLGGEVEVIPLGRARTGLYLMTKYAVAGGRKKVILSPHTIPDVVNMVVLAGGEPCFVDHLPLSTNIDVSHLESLIDDNTACVLVTHYHVNQEQLPAIVALCKRRGVPLYDDCAISFGGSTASGPIGSVTDGSLFSFSFYKFLNYFWGGALTTRDANLARFVRDEMKSWKRLSYADYVYGARFSIPYDFLTRPLVFQMFTFPALKRRSKRSAKPETLQNRRLENVVLDPTLTTLPSYAAFAHWRRRLLKIDGLTAHRRRIARVYSAAIGDYMVSPETSPETIEGSCFVNFPIAVPEGARDRIHHDLISTNYDVGQSLYPNVHASPSYATAPGRSQRVQQLVDSTLYLPTHFGVDEDYAHSLADRVRNLIGRNA